jgi:hypothetical protein
MRHLVYETVRRILEIFKTPVGGKASIALTVFKPGNSPSV